ncbi:MAG TPA: hypothetical protein VGI87_15445 [Solirubrobacteraceae bacterium]|jgi:uncharacterized protein YukE
MSSFGFEVPQGDPGALMAASTAWRRLGVALVNEGEAVTNGARAALAAGGWEGPASGAFAGSAEKLISAFTTDADACGKASSALEQLSHALQHAQQVARQALADCATLQQTAETHQRAANEAGNAADAAQQRAAAAAHPAVAAQAQHEATQALQRQTSEGTAAFQASEQLVGVQTRGQQAVAAYEQEARTIIGQLNAAAGELEGGEQVESGWAEPVLTWVGHVNDFSGAGAVGLIKGYDSALAIAGAKLADEAQTALGDPQAVASILNGKPPAAFDGAEDPTWNVTENAGKLANNPLTKTLTAGPSEEKFGVLGKVPYLAYGLTALDMYQNRDEGVGKAVVEPLGNLAVSTALTEGSSAVVAPAIAEGAATLAAGDGALAALAGTAFVPGVGEVVIVGAIAVGGTYLVDKGAEWVWDHRAAIGHALATAGTATVHGLETAGTATVHGLETAGTATVHGLESAGSATVHGLESAGSTVAHGVSTAVHDAEPWNW